MEAYQKILLAVSFDEESDRLPLRQAQQLVAEFGSELFLIHVIENHSCYGSAYAVSVGTNIEELMASEASKNMAALGEQVGVCPDHQFILSGQSCSVILEKSKELDIDLIVLGSHGKHGLGLLLGSTVNEVLGEATCDVLAVRLGSD